MAFDVAAIRNWNVRGTTIQPGSATTDGKASENPYPAVDTAKSAEIQGRCRSRACSIGSPQVHFWKEVYSRMADRRIYCRLSLRLDNPSS